MDLVNLKLDIMPLMNVKSNAVFWLLLRCSV